MARCFVIQPFDNGPFDKRYEDVIAPAIESAGLEPYRVDRDTSVTIPIETIESEIRESVVCLADITTDNPNVWFELGYALASGKDIVLICSKDRPSHYPFDIQHRSVIPYAPESTRDFQQLGQSITERLKAYLKKQQTMQTINAMGPLKETEGLSAHELVALATIMEHRLTPDSSVYPRTIEDGMTAVGYTSLACSLSLESLLNKGLISFAFEHDVDTYETVPTYRITNTGIERIMQCQDKLRLRIEDFS